MGSVRYGLIGPGDLNNDGLADLLATDDSTGCLYRWNGNTNSQFNGPVFIGCGWGPYMHRVTGAGDLDDDGKGDIVAVIKDNGCLYRWAGDGKGWFGPGTPLSCGWWSYSSIGIMSGMGDLDGDDRGDLVAMSLQNGCLSGGTGTGWVATGAGRTSGAAGHRTSSPREWLARDVKQVRAERWRRVGQQDQCRSVTFAP